MSITIQDKDCGRCLREARRSTRSTNKQSPVWNPLDFFKRDPWKQPKHPPVRKPEPRPANLKPLKAKDVKLSTKINSIIKFNPKEDLGELQHYDNFANQHQGYKYQKNANGQLQIDLQGKNLPEAVSFAAFNLFSNDKTSIQLGQRNFAQDFDDMIPADSKVRDKMTEDDFMTFHKVYVKNATGELGRNDGTIRVSTETVNMNEYDEKHLKKLYKIMAGADGILTKTKNIDFNKKLFDKYASGKDGQDNILTRKELEQYMDSIAAQPQK